MPVATTGQNYIDSLLSGKSWTGNSGQSANITYAFPSSAYVVPANLKASYLAAMDVWKSVANITFTQVNEAVSKFDMHFGDLAPLDPGMLGVTYMSSSGSQLVLTQAVIDNRYSTPSSLAKGTQGFMVLLHEMGHALGLKHPGNYSGTDTGPFLPGGQDNYNATLMSYYSSAQVNSTTNAPSTPMIFDIAAIQHLYGANMSYNATNTTYTLNGSTTTYTIWDANGTDTITSMGYSGNAILDLREGVDYFSKVGNSTVWNAFNARIENATGGSGADTMFGNDLANTLQGNNGNDTITGGNGNDTIMPGYGNDKIYGDAGTDTIDDRYGGDTVYGGGDGDMIILTDDADYVYGDEESQGTGTDGNDSIYVYGGNDYVIAGGGNDSIWGSTGNDTIKGGNGDDWISGGANNDSLSGQVGNDSFYFSNNSGTDTITDFTGAGAGVGDLIQFTASMNGLNFSNFAAFSGRISYVGGNAIIDLGSGNTITLIGVAAGLTAHDFVIV